MECFSTETSGPILAKVQTATVLVVEDNLVNQRVSRSMLQRLGYRVEIANNGLEGVEMWSIRDYVAIIMDCQMPVLDGYKATTRIRELEMEHANTRRRMPIIALTAHSMSYDRQKCLDSGMDDFLTKPVALGDLGAALERWLEAIPSEDVAEPVAS